MKNFNYAEVPASFRHCVSVTCPMRNNCLRALAWQSIDASRSIISIVNPILTHEGEGCPYLRPAEPVEYAVGFASVENELTGLQIRQFREQMIKRVGKYKYYAYRSGRIPMSPTEQETVLAVLHEVGALPKHPFDAYEKRLPWAMS